jgi:hypothetical protein
LVALGLIEVTEQGRAGNAEFRTPSKYRITYRHADRANPTDEWNRITEEDAAIIAKAARQPHSNPPVRIQNWFELSAPWMLEQELKALIAAVLAKPLRFRADTVAARLQVTEADRRRLRLTTIGAIDRSKAERLADRKQRKRQADRASRRAQGAKPRAEYEAASITRARPWDAIGVSRRTWYRRRGQPTAAAVATGIPRRGTSASTA